MEFNERLDQETNENAVEVTNEQPQVEIADTSTESFFYDRDTAIDNQEQQIQQEAINENNEQVEADSTGNEYLDALYDWAEQNDVNIKEMYGEFDAENFNQDHLKYIVGKTQAINHLESTDPELHNILSRGININDYVQERMNYEKMLNTDDATLFKGQMYNYLLNKNIEMGVATANEDGSLSEQSHQMIIDEIERLTNGMSPEQYKEKGEAIRQNLYNQMQQIPDYLQKRYEQQHQQSIERYQAERQEYLEGLKKFINKSNSIVVGFADQSAKDDFAQFIDEQTQLSEVEVNGQKQMVVPLFHQLQNDNEFLLQTLRLHHMMKNGYFTDTTNRARNKAYKELGIMPTSKGGSGRKSNAQTYKGVKIADTSSKDFYSL